jgi:hypothetical protein
MGRVRSSLGSVAVRLQAFLIHIGRWEGASDAAIEEEPSIAERLPDRSYQQRRALRRAGRAAFRCPVEASDLVAEGHSLTELRFVGPWLAHLIREMLVYFLSSGTKA